MRAPAILGKGSKKKKKKNVIQVIIFPEQILSLIHWILNLSFKDDFILAFKMDENFDLKSWLPFKGKIKLPSKLEVLKLVLFLRDEVGRTNQWVKAENIYKIQVCCEYCPEVLGQGRIHYEDQDSQRSCNYKKLQKDQNHQTPSCVKSRENFLMARNEKDERREKLFDIAHKDLEQKLC